MDVSAGNCSSMLCGCMLKINVEGDSGDHGEMTAFFDLG